MTVTTKLKRSWVIKAAIPEAQHPVSAEMPRPAPIIRGDRFLCDGCLAYRPSSESSQDPRYCQDCYGFICQEASKDAQVKRTTEYWYGLLFCDDHDHVWLEDICVGKTSEIIPMLKRQGIDDNDHNFDLARRAIEEFQKEREVSLMPKTKGSVSPKNAPRLHEGLRAAGTKCAVRKSPVSLRKTRKNKAFCPSKKRTKTRAVARAKN